MNKLSKFIIAITVSQLAGIIGSLFTTPAIPGWYASLVKPSFNPPNWIFGPVWTTLFILMGVALFIVWTTDIDRDIKKRAITIFGVQLVLNTLWSIIFFGFQSPGAAFLEIVVLWAMILWTIIAFYKISKKSAYLLVPYIVWVSFASVLNYFIWILN